MLIGLCTCTPAQGVIVESQVPTDVLTDIQCVATELLQGAIDDPLAILAQCGPLTIAQLITLGQNLLTAPNAALAANAKITHYPRITLTDVQRTRISTIVNSAVALNSGDR